MQFVTDHIFQTLDGVNIHEQFMKKAEGALEAKAEVGVRPVTTGIALSMCLLQGGQDIPATQWSDRYVLALKLRSEKEVVLSADQLAICKSVANKHPDGIITAQLCMYLEGKHPVWNSTQEATPKAPKKR